MRKTAKILSVLLTLCLLCGVMLSVVASAAGIDYHTDLDLTEHTGNVSVNFDDGETAGTWSNIGATADGVPTGIKSDFVSSGDNKYFVVTPDSSTDVNVSTVVYFRSGEKNVTGAKYITVDFDFGTDKYIYVADLVSDNYGNYDTASWVPVDGYTAIPAYGFYEKANRRSDTVPYNDGTNRGFDLYSTLVANGSTVNFTTQYIGCDVDTGKFYLFNSGEEKKVYLSNEVGVFDHITKLYKIVGDNTNGYIITEYTYVNGELCWTLDKTLESITTLKTGSIGIRAYSYGYKDSSSRGRFYSYAFDNIAYNTYGSDYTTAPAEGEDDTVYGLDDFVAAGATSPIYTCDDVLYNEKYITPNPDRFIEALGNKYYIINQGTDILEDSINITKSDKNKIYTYEDSNSGFAALTGNAGKTLNFEVKKSASGNKYFSISPNADETTISYSSGQAIRWDEVVTSGVKYVTFDFDFGTDKYVYYDGNDVPHTTANKTIAEQYDKYYPAYGGGNLNFGRFRFDYTLDGSTKQAVIADLGIRFDSTSKLYYIYCGSGAERAYLSNEVGIYDHISIVAEITNNSGKYTLSGHVYVNGIYLTTATNTITPDENTDLTVRDFYVCAYSVGYLSSKFSDQGDSYAWAYENLAINYYADNYEFSVDNGLDTVTRTEPIYNCNDAVYNKYTYTTPNPERYITVNGTKTYVINAGIDAINAMAGSENSVTTSVDVNYAPKAELTGFNLTLVNGAKFNTSKGAFSYVTADENAYIVSRITTKANVDLFGDMTFNLYVPVAEGALTKIDGADSSVFGEFDDKSQYKISWTPSIESFATQDVVLYYGDAVSSTITLDVVKYAEAVMSATKEDGTTLLYPCGSEAAVLVYEMMNYKAAVAEYAGESVSASYNEFIALYNSHDSETCTCKTTPNAPYADQGQTGLSGVGIAYQVDTDKIGIVITGVADNTAVSVSYSYMYESELKTESFAAVDKGDYYLVNIPAAFLYKTLTFNIGGTEFDYSLAQYIYNKRSGDDGLDATIEALNATIADLQAKIEAAGEEDTSDLDAQLATAQSELEVAQDTVYLVNRMYRYSVAAFEYKYDYTNITPAE